MNFNLKGDGNIYVISILALVMAAAFALTSGLRPQFDETPTNAQEVIIDEDSINNANENSLQLVDLKIKSFPTIVTTPATSPALTATPTPVCGDQSIVAVLVDTSESMIQNGKNVALENALKNFKNNISPNTVFGLFAFGDNDLRPRERLSFAILSQQYGYDRIISEFKYPSGGTYMRDAFVDLNLRLDAVRTNPTYAGFRTSVVFISDGVPEVVPCVPSQTRGGACVSGVRNYSLAQDPTTSPNIIQTIKNKGINIYTVGIFNDNDLAANRELKVLLQGISSGTSYYKQSNDTASNLESLFSEIGRNVCS